MEQVARLEREIAGEESANGTVVTAEQAADVIERIEEIQDPLDQPTLVIPN